MVTTQVSFVCKKTSAHDFADITTNMIHQKKTFNSTIVQMTTHMVYSPLQEVENGILMVQSNGPKCMYK